jgi:hypothetical protein
MYSTKQDTSYFVLATLKKKFPACLNFRLTYKHQKYVVNRIQYISNDYVKATSLAGDDATSFPIWMEVLSK